MTDWASPTFEDDVIADMRAHGGSVTAGSLTGQPLLIDDLDGREDEGAPPGES